MAKNVTLIRVFVSSPEDLRADRQLVEEAAKELNQTSCFDKGIRLEVFSWKTAGFPDFGPDSQAVLNRQLKEFDIYVGLMGHTFGSATPRAGSGTEEEFRSAYERWKADPRSCRLMFYFNEAPVAPSEFDPRELLKVREFRSNLGRLGGLYWTYSSASGDLPELLRRHLLDVIRDYGNNWGIRTNIASEASAWRDGIDGQRGQLDFAAVAEDASRATARVLAMIKAASVQMGKEIREAPLNVTAIREPGALTASAARQQAGMVASAVLGMVVRMDFELPHMIQSWTAFRQNVMLALGSAADPETEQEREALRGSAALLKAGQQPLVDARDGVGLMKLELQKLGNFSRELREAERRANASLAAFVTEIDRELADLRELESAIITKLGTM